MHQSTEITVLPQGIADSLRKRQNRGRKNNRHDPAGIDAKRQVGGLSAHDLAPDNTFGVLHRNATLAAFDIDDEGHHHNHQGDQNEHGRRSKGAPSVGANLVIEIGDATRQSYDNAREDQQRHAVPDTALRNLFAQPHDERAASGEREHGHQAEAPAGVDDEISATLFQADRNPKRLNRAQHHGEIARPLSNFLAAEFAFFLQLGQWLIDHGQKLQDNRSGDVGHDTQGEDGHPLELTAAE